MGLKYTSRLESLDQELGLPDGSSLGRMKRMRALSIRFFRTIAAKFGQVGGDSEDIIFRTSASPTGQQIEPVSDVRNMNLQGSYDDEQRFFVETDEGLPMGVSAVSVRMETNAAVN